MMGNKIFRYYAFLSIIGLSACSQFTRLGYNPTLTLDAGSTNTTFIDTVVAPSTPTDTPSIIYAPTDIPSSTPTMEPSQSSTETLIDPPTQSLTVNLEAVGDIMLARSIGLQVQDKGPQVVFAGVQPVLDKADILIGNLECAITSAGRSQHKTYTFAAPPETVQALALAGFDVLALANNHAMDYGAQGLTDTIDYLNQNGIAGVGAGKNATEAHRPILLDRNGLRMAFLAYVNVPVENDGFDTHTWIATSSQPGIAWANLDQITVDVIAAKKEADVVIVLLHSGYEITTIIPNISKDQTLAAHTAIDAGATVVIGSHTHFLESIERYHNGLIAYSLGNFVFDDYQGIANASIILSVVLTPTGYQSYEWIPVLIKNGLPELTDLNSTLAIGTMIAPINP